MNICLYAFHLNSLGFYQNSSFKPVAFIIALKTQDLYLIINGLLCVAVILLLFFLLFMVKSLQSLKASAQENKHKGNTWVKRKLYDFDAQQLDILTKKIKNPNRNDKQIEAKN
ncbi:MAG TPA: hypothetical protein VF273_02990 [Pelobium sp.]